MGRISSLRKRGHGTLRRFGEPGNRMNEEAPTPIGSSSGAWDRRALQPLARIGKFARAQPAELRHLAAIVGTALLVALRPRQWKREARNAFGRNLLEVGVEPLLFVCALAVFVGVSVVVQLAFWIGEAGQSQLVGPLLVAVVARELGPMLINLVVIVRSGSAMTTQMGVLKIEGKVLDRDGIGCDVFCEMVVPRLLAVALSTMCLTLVFILMAFASGFVFAAWTGKGSGDLSLFVNTVANAIHPEDILNISAKSILPPLFASACWCVGGLSVTTATDIPPATQRALTRSVAGLFAISAVISLLTYL
jgi:phospholipid/cholesterol/gamma-HCH transport system permease protein